MALEVTSKSIQGIADLVICAPIKQGFIDAFENVTFETRLRLATDAFHKMRVMAREYEPIKPFTDVAERIQSLLAFRIGILDTQPQRSLYLAATFDRPWEPYMRLIWEPLGTFLDVLLCNCEGYVPASDSSFSEYAAWVRAHQVDSTIFYATTPLTVGDQFYLSKLERLQRTGGPAGNDLALARMTADDPEGLAKGVREVALADANLKAQFLTMATEALVVLYRLADYYPPDRLQGEGKYLLRAAKDLFLGWDTQSKEVLPLDVRMPHEEMFNWLEGDAPERPGFQADPKFDPGQVQAGVLSGYDRGGAVVNHGCLLLYSVTDAKKAREFIKSHLGYFSWEGGNAKATNGVFLNIAITYRGLCGLQVDPDVIKGFPKEFREGMDERAGFLGDIHANHPRNWPRPQRFIRLNDQVYTDRGGPSPPERVEMSEIDLVLQVRTSEEDWSYAPIPNNEAELEASERPLAKAIWRLRDLSGEAGVTLLSIESMRRIPAKNGCPRSVRDHFGFSDFVSQPRLQVGATKLSRDDVKRGELLIGYTNDRGDPPPPPDPFLDNGSFLVIRKMSQDVEALDGFLEAPTGANPALDGDPLLAKMMGRDRGGTPLVANGAPGFNNFDFLADGDGARCPFQAHIRRANPRLSGYKQPPPPFGRPTPRIMRRGMSYGPTLDEGPVEAERGSMFMAYGASIAEQYEVIQRWINGGNSTSVAAVQNDPLVGVYPATGGKTFRFVDGGQVVRVDIPKAFVGLEWGLYLFVPSKAALSKIAETDPDPERIGEADRGEAIIAGLTGLPEDTGRLAWKTYLEDFSTKDPAERCDTPDVWAAIREYHGGALRTTEGVIVASKDLIAQVLINENGNYTVSGEAQRMQHSFGEIYIGFDAGARYERESAETNSILRGVTKEQAFDVAFEAAGGVLKDIFDKVDRISAEHKAVYPAEIDLRRDFISPVLAFVCNYWFGLPESPRQYGREGPSGGAPLVVAGGWSWRSSAARKPRCPGDFMAPSRYCFYPNPTDAIVAYGIVQGQALWAAAKRHFDQLRPPEGGPATRPKAPVAAKMFDAIHDNDQLSRTLIGVMTGALPPIDGNLRSVLYDWLKEKSLWRYQTARLTSRGTSFGWASKSLEAPMMRAMQKRPAPDLLWRTATRAHRLGNVVVQPQEMIILAIASATLDDLNRNNTEVDTIFGNKKGAAQHPLHACPAYDMAIGTMLGVLTALFEVGQIEALPAPLLVNLKRRKRPPGAQPAK